MLVGWRLVSWCTRLCTHHMCDPFRIGVIGRGEGRAVLISAGAGDGERASGREGVGRWKMERGSTEEGEPRASALC